ncbi:hypothetical protein TNCV_2702151 [Trichonephila clavipes]|nr:hypothetical protein TNCV_2702151 [Trichonephila clavipes]
MVLKATANDRRYLALCHVEFRGPRSGLCRSGGIRNNNKASVKVMRGGELNPQPPLVYATAHDGFPQHQKILLLGMNKIRKTPAVLDCLIILSEESIAVDDDNVYTTSIMADKDILKFVQS